MFKSMKAPKNGAGSSAESLAPEVCGTGGDGSPTQQPSIIYTLTSSKVVHHPGAGSLASTPSGNNNNNNNNNGQLDQPEVKEFRTPGSLLSDDDGSNNNLASIATIGVPNSASTASTDLANCQRRPPNPINDFAVNMNANRPPPAPRSQSAGSSKSVASTMSSTEICRICHCEATNEMPLISPCYCSGTLKYVHQKCLQQWIKSSQTRSCEVCRFSFIMQTKLKPFRKWEKLDISSVERRKILCSVAFHVIAITCVIWSLYVLIDRTAEEIQNNSLEWPFWTKLVVVAIGFTGGLVFMYVQCKMYVQLFRRWKAYNKVIYVQDGPSGLNSLTNTKGAVAVNVELK